jgi:hypothetical protein
VVGAAVSIDVSADRKPPPVRRPAKRATVLTVLIELYPNGLPNNQVTVVIWDNVNRRLRQLGKQTVSLKTVKRALRDFLKSRV